MQHYYAYEKGKVSAEGINRCGAFLTHSNKLCCARAPVGEACNSSAKGVPHADTWQKGQTILSMIEKAMVEHYKFDFENICQEYERQVNDLSESVPAAVRANVLREDISIKEEFPRHDGPFVFGVRAPQPSPPRFEASSNQPRPKFKTNSDLRQAFLGLIERAATTQTRLNNVNWNRRIELPTQELEEVKRMNELLTQANEDLQRKQTLLHDQMQELQNEVSRLTLEQGEQQATIGVVYELLDDVTGQFNGVVNRLSTNLPIPTDHSV